VYGLKSSLAPVHSSSKASLHLALQIDGQYQPASQSTVQIDMTLTDGSLPMTAPGETHQWQFTFSKPTFVQVNAKRNTFSIATGSRMNPFGQVKISFTPTSSYQLACQRGPKQTVWTGALSGVVRLNTLSLAWGSVGSPTNKFMFPKGSTLELNGCRAAITPRPCESGQEWFSNGHGVPEGNGVFASQQILGQSLTVDGAKHAGVIEARQQWFLPQPAGAMRFDYVDAFLRSQSYDPATHDLTITPETGKGRLFSGSPVQITTDGTSDFSDSESCVQQGQAKTQNDNENYHATWTNGAEPLTAQMALGGPISDPNGAGHAGLTLWSVS